MSFGHLVPVAIVAALAIPAAVAGQNMTHKISPDLLGQTHRAPQTDGYTYFDGSETNFNAAGVRLTTPAIHIPVQVLDNPPVHYDIGQNSINTTDPEITTANQASLKKTIDFLKNNPDCVVQIYSQTSATGSKEYNQRLSEKRSETILAELTKMAQADSIDVTRIQIITVNVGEKDALAVTGDNVEDINFRKSIINCVRPAKTKEAEIYESANHVIYIGRQSASEINVGDGSTPLSGQTKSLKQSIIERFTAQGKELEFIPVNFTIVVDVNNPNPKKLTLKELDAETIAHMTVATYDKTAGRSAVPAEISINDTGELIVTATNLTGGDKRTLLTVTSDNAADLTQIQAATLTPSGAVIAVEQGKSHIASQPEVAPVNLQSLPAAAPTTGQRYKQ
jgi:outer membrane protein OmpA-like peptidoglycan-associated protein